MREGAEFCRGDGIWKVGIGAVLDPLGFNDDWSWSFGFEERCPARSTIKVDSSLILGRQEVGLFHGCIAARGLGGGGRSCDIGTHNDRSALERGAVVIRFAKFGEGGDEAAIGIGDGGTGASGQVVQDDLGWEGLKGFEISENRTEGDIGSLRKDWAEK